MNPFSSLGAVYQGVNNWIQSDDKIPGINVGNIGRQAVDRNTDYDIFDNVTVSGRPGQVSVPGTGAGSTRGYSLDGGIQGSMLDAANQGGANTGQYDQYGNYIGGSGGGGGGGRANSDPNQAAWYADQAAQLQAQLDRLGSQESMGLQNIGNSYNRSYNRLQEQRGVNERNYNTSVQQSDQGYANTRGGIMNQTNATANALQRLLGINGAGNSSAALYAAPYAAGLQGSQSMNEAQQTYANNRSALDTSWEDAQRGYSNAFADLDQQKFSHEQNLRSSIAQTRAGLLSKIAEANQQRQIAMGSGYESARAAANPYLQQVNSLLDSIAGLSNQFANPVMRTADVRYSTPNLGKYSLGQGGGVQQAQGAPESDMNSALLPILADRERDEYGQRLSY